MEQARSLYRKIAEIMGELNVPKDGKNTHFNYAYFTADAVADAVREKLAARNVAFFASIVGREPLEIRNVLKSGEVVGKPRWVVDFKFVFADGDSGEIQECTWSAEADANDDKGINKCATAAEKYFLLKTFIVSTGDETDADASDEKPRRGTQNSPQHPTTTQPRQNAPASQIGGKSGNSASASVEQLTNGLGANVTRIEDAPLPRNSDGLPVLGLLDMGALLRLSFEAGHVTGKHHFANLIDLLYREGSIRDASTADAVLSAVAKHAAEKAKVS